MMKKKKSMILSSILRQPSVGPDGAAVSPIVLSTTVAVAVSGEFCFSGAGERGCDDVGASLEIRGA